jgi:hypothetical protein
MGDKMENGRILYPIVKLGAYGLHIQKCPSGRFSFVGTIPLELCKVDKFGNYDSLVFGTKKEAETAALEWAFANAKEINSLWNE